MIVATVVLLYSLCGLLLVVGGHFLNLWGDSVYSQPAVAGILVVAWPIVLLIGVLYGLAFSVGRVARYVTRAMSLKEAKKEENETQDEEDE